MPAALAAQSPRHWAPGKSHGLSCPQSSHGCVLRPPLSQGCWAFAKPPLTQGGSAGRLPAALHVLWGQVLKIWVGGGLGFWGQLGKRPGKSWASEEADRVGEATLDALGRSPGQRVCRRAGLGPARQWPPAQGRGARQRRLRPPRPAPCPPWRLPPGGHCSRTGSPGPARNVPERRAPCVRLGPGVAPAPWGSPIRLRPPTAPQKPVWTSPSRPFTGTGSHLVTCSRSTAAGPSAPQRLTLGGRLVGA